MITLEICDILLFINDRSGPIADLSRWAIGPYEHVAMYVGKLDGVAMVYESRGRGVSIASLLPQTGKPVAVMRPLRQALGPVERVDLLDTACEVAADEKSFYDYLCIVYSVLPRVLVEKLPWLPLPVKYHRDIFMICSEAVAEVFWRNEVAILPHDIVPLPGDFASSPILICVGVGKLMEDVVP